MMHKRWTLVLVVVAFACLVAAGLGIVYLGRTVPGVARLLARATPAPTAIPIGGLDLAHLLSTATLTPSPTPEPTATMAPSDAPSPPPTARASATGLAVPAASETPSATTTPSPTPSATPSPTPRPGWIAFESQRGELGDYEIVVMRPDGSQQTNLTRSWADDLAPAWSPSGRQIAFVSLRDTLTGKWGLENSSIYGLHFDPVRGAAGEVWRITDGEGSDGWPTWSPDGQRIAFHSDRSGNWDIWIVGIDGSGLVQLTTNPRNDRYPNWSADGKIAFTSNRGGSEDIWVLDVEEALRQGDDSAAVNLTQTAHRDRYAIWSPDARQLTFNTNRDGDFEVYVMNADGSEPRNLSRSPDSTEGLADWSPDARRLVFYSDRGGNKNVYILDLASLAWTNISNHPASDEYCAWSP
jgi:Tol biopolymer transport system component